MGILTTTAPKRIPSMPTDWKPELKNLGKEPDTKIAERLGVSREAVRLKRKELGIEKFEVVWGSDLTPESVAEHRRPELTQLDMLKQVPLPVELLQTLIDARLAKGWTQVELAKQVGMTPFTIARLERGTPVAAKTLETIASTLGFVMEVEVHVDLKKQRKRKR